MNTLIKQLSLTNKKLIGPKFYYTENSIEEALQHKGENHWWQITKINGTKLIEYCYGNSRSQKSYRDEDCEIKKINGHYFLVINKTHFALVKEL